MQWRNWIDQGYADGTSKGRAEFQDGAKVERIAWLESQLGLRLPVPLRELLEESDGVGQMMYLYDKWSRVHTEVWSCDTIAQENKTIRADPEGPLPPPFAPESVPLYFASAAVDGILFAFLMHPSAAQDPAVYAFYPIESEWRRISPSLEAHLHGWTV